MFFPVAWRLQKPIITTPTIIPTQPESQILVAQLIPVTLDISYIQDRIRMSGPQTQRLIHSVVHLHVSSTTRCPHQKADRNNTRHRVY